MAAIWEAFFGRNGQFCQTHETIRINYHGQLGTMVRDTPKKTNCTLHTPPPPAHSISLKKNTLALWKIIGEYSNIDL